MNNSMLNYEIKYSKIKNVYIQIKEGKVIVKAPKKVKKEEIEKIIEQKSDWIRKKLEKGKDGQQYIQTHIGIGYRMLRVEQADP